MTLELREVCVRAGGRTLLGEVCLDLRPGEVLAVLGPNGAGKSTLLRAAAGTQRLTGGRVVVDGRQIDAWDATELARRRAALLQGTTMRFSFSALEVVLLGRLPHGGGRAAADRAIAAAALAEVDSLHLAARDVNRLSGGEQQRVQIARALAQVWSEAGRRAGGSYLLFDEPTSGLDLAHQHGVLKAMRRFAESGTAVLVVLHDLNLAARYADLLLILRDGVPVEYGAPRQVLRPEVVLRNFGVAVRVIDNPAAPGCPFAVDLGTAEERSAAPPAPSPR